MDKKYKILWITSIILVFLSLNYLPGFGWWISTVGTILIILFSYLSWPTNFRARLGIPKKTIQYLFSLFLLLPLIVGSYYLINQIRIQNNLGFGIGYIQNFTHIFFYTLNEEFILGGLLLLSLKNKYVKFNPIFISIGVAIFFSIIHYIFYRWVFQGQAQGILSILTLISLLLIGILRNNLVLKTGHIGYSWALHFSWMALMFGCAFYDPSNNIQLSESERFNLFIGNEITLCVVFILVIITSAWILTGMIKFKEKL